MSDVIHDLKIVDNVFVKLMVCKEVGMEIVGHAHTFDHITLLATGAVTMFAKNTCSDYRAPMLIVTPKGVVHRFVALEPDTVLCCIHAIRDGDEMDDIAPPNITNDEARKLISQFPLAK